MAWKIVSGSKLIEAILKALEGGASRELVVDNTPLSALVVYKYDSATKLPLEAHDSSLSLIHIAQVVHLPDLSAILAPGDGGGIAGGRLGGFLSLIHIYL